MNVSESIRSLARDGLGVADIARQLGIRYQYAYNVLKADGLQQLASSRAVASQAPAPTPPLHKPPLTVQKLIQGGFEFSAYWVLSETGEPIADRALPKSACVYAFAIRETAVYVGVATKGLRQRMYQYRNPGSSQSMNERLNKLIRKELQAEPFIEIYTATPPDLEWNGLPVSSIAGLEYGLIKKHAVTWNILNAG